MVCHKDCGGGYIVVIYANSRCGPTGKARRGFLLPGGTGLSEGELGIPELGIPGTVYLFPVDHPFVSSSSKSHTEVSYGQDRPRCHTQVCRGWGSDQAKPLSNR